MKNHKIILTKITKGPFDQIEVINYDVINRQAEVIRRDSNKKDKKSKTNKKFEEDINAVRRLARKEIAGLHKKIKNNKNVLILFRDDEAELKKTSKHLERNEHTLGLLEEFLINK